MIHLDSRGFKSHKSWKPTKNYLSLWLLNLFEPCDTSQWKEESNVLKLNIMKYHSIFWGSLTSIPAFFLFPYCSLAIYFTICIYLHVWIRMCWKIHVLCTTWFVISLIQLWWIKSNSPNNKYKAQDPYFYLGLGTVQNKNPQR